MEIKYKSYKELPIKKFFELEDYINNTDDELVKLVSVLSVLCDTDEDTISNLEIGEINELKNQLGWLSESPNIQKNFKSKTIELPVFGKCVIDTDLRKFTISQYIDFQTFWNKMNTNPEMLLSVFVIPKGKKYADGYDTAELIDVISNNIDIITAREMSFFILKRLVNSIVNTLIFLESQMKMKRVLTMNKQKKQLIMEKIEEIKQLKAAVRTIGCV